jgi:hypothetical protein
MSPRILPVALMAALAAAACKEPSQEPAATPTIEERAAEAAPPDVAQPALMVKGASRALLLDLVAAGPRLIAVGRQGVIVASDDGHEWTQVASPVGAMLTRAYFLDEQQGWIVGYDGTILHSADGGKTWALQHHDPEARALYDVWFRDAQHGIAVGAYGSFYRTTDGGKTWTAESSPLVELGQHFNRVLPLEGDMLFAAGERGLVARSTDGGETWQMLQSPYIGSFFGAIALGGPRVLVFGMRGNVFVIDDVTQVPVQDPAQYDPYTVQTLEDPAQIAALGWRRLDSPIRESFFGGAQLKDGSVLLVGTNAEAVRSDAALQSLKVVDLPAAETLADLMPHESGLLAVGRRGVQNLGALP